MQLESTSLVPRVQRIAALALVAGAVVSASAAAQVVQSKLLPQDVILAPFEVGPSFGESVGLVPGWAFAGAPLDADVALVSGAVYVHQQVGNLWLQTQKLKAPLPKFGETFGQTLAAADDWLVVGTPGDQLGTGGQPKGSAHVFLQQGGTWTHHQKLIPFDSSAPGTEHFGESVAIKGGILVVGEPDDDYKASNSGSVYVFELQGSNWVEVSKLTNSDWEVNGSFGRAVSTDGVRLAIGSVDDNGVFLSDQGAAYVFEKLGGVWTETQKLTASDPGKQNYFGGAVAIDGDRLLVGANGHYHPAPPKQEGAAYAFALQNGVWAQTQELFPSDPWNPLLFGSAVALEGELAIVGARGDGDQGMGSGSAYAFRLDGTQWVQFGKLLAPDGAQAEVLSYSADLLGEQVILGAYGDDDGCNELWNCNVGSAYVFELASDTQQYGSCLSSGICGNSDDHGGCASSSGQGAVLAAGGTTSTSADTLRLETRWLPQNVFGILFMGGSKNWLPFGDGRLAVGSGATGVFRLLPPKLSGSAGAMTWDGGLVALSQSVPIAGHIQPGDTWYFQTWFRDPTGPCGSGFNTSNGLQVDFKP